MKNILIGQSGGPTSVINASLAGIIQKSKLNNFKIFGSIAGIRGIIEDNIVDINNFIKDDIDLHKLIQTPSAFLKTCRYKVPDFEDDNQIYTKIFSTFKKYNITDFFYIGGNDSMDTVDKLTQYSKKIDYKINIIGIPKTIDNDLACTDHTPGFASAAKFIATCVKEISKDMHSYEDPYVIILEVMGRNTGWLAASSAISSIGEDCQSPDLIYLPEISFSLEKFIVDVNNILSKKNKVFVVVSEGIKDSNNNYICDADAEFDLFGHKKLGGVGYVLNKYIEKHINCKSRYIELSLLQRCASHLASLIDIKEAFDLGQKAIEFASKKNTGIMLTIKRIKSKPYKYKIESVEVKQIANKEKCIPQNWINDDQNYPTQEFIEYIIPLIQGENSILYENGMPAHITL